MDDNRINLLKADLQQGLINRRTFIKYALALGLTAPTVSTLLTACAPPPGNPTAAPTPIAQPTAIPPTAVPPTAAPTKAPVAAPTATTGPKKLGGKLTVTYMSSNTRDAAAKEMAPAFEEKWGTKVTIAAFPWMTLVKNNTTDLLTGAGLYDVQSGSVNANLWAFYEPLDPYIKRDNWKLPFVPGLMDKVARMEGQQLGIPYAADSYGMVIRTELFEQAGIPIPTKAWTWDEFDKNIAELDGRFKKDGIRGFVLAGGAVDQNGPFFWGRYDSYHWSKDGTQKHDPDKAIAAFKRLKAQLAYCPPNVMGLSIDEANAVFLQGKACILECWPSFIRGIINDPKQSKVVGKWAFMPYPEPGFDYLSVWDMLINRFSKNKDAAWEWIKYYINPDVDKNVLFKKYGDGLVFTTTLEDPDLIKERGNDFPATKANLVRAKKPVVTDEAEWFLGEVTNEVLHGKSSPEDAIKKINDKWATLQGTRPEYELAIVQDLMEK